MSPSSPSEGRVDGHWFDGRQSRGHAARLCWQAGELVLECDGQSRPLARAGLRLGTQVSGAAGTLHLADGSVFETRDQAALERLWQALGGPRAGWRLRHLERSGRLILASAVLVLASLVLGFTHGVPWVARLVAEAMPARVETWLGQQSLDSLDRTWLEPSRLDEARQAAVLAAMAPHLEAFARAGDGRPLQVLFRSSELIGANAMALPGGILVFTDGLVELAKDDRELIAVLAHEAGHVAHRHSLRGVVQGSLAFWVMVSITGDLSAASDLTTSLPAIFANLAYSRGMEREADAFALAHLREQGLSPRHFVDIMRRLDPPNEEDDEGVGRLAGFLSTHPPTAERLEGFSDAAPAE